MFERTNIPFTCDPVQSIVPINCSELSKKLSQPFRSLIDQLNVQRLVFHTVMPSVLNNQATCNRQLEFPLKIALPNKSLMICVFRIAPSFVKSAISLNFSIANIQT